MFTFFTKREIIEVFTSLSCSDGKEIYKKLDALAELLFCQSNLIAFCAVLVDVAFVVA